MFYFEDIPKRLVREFNKANKTALTLDAVEFLDPRPVSSLSPKPQTTCNTAVTMQLKPGALYTGETTLYYNRVDLGTKFKHAPLGTKLALKVDDAKGTHDILPELSKRIGAKLDPKDFYNDSVTVKMGLSPLTVRARPGSLLWTGSMTVLVWRLDPSSDIVFDYPGKLWTSSDAVADAGNKIVGKYQFAHYSYSYDYTNQAAVLKTIASAPGAVATNRLDLTTAVALKNALTAVDGQAWDSKTSTSPTMNIYAAWPIYNGRVSGWKDLFVKYPNFGGATMQEAFKTFNDIFSDEYDNVLVLELNNPTYGTWGWPCYAIFHYNDF